MVLRVKPTPLLPRSVMRFLMVRHILSLAQALFLLQSVRLIRLLLNLIVSMVLSLRVRMIPTNSLTSFRAVRPLHISLVTVLAYFTRRLILLRPLAPQRLTALMRCAFLLTSILLLRRQAITQFILLPAIRSVVLLSSFLHFRRAARVMRLTLHPAFPALMSSRSFLKRISRRPRISLLIPLV